MPEKDVFLIMLEKQELRMTWGSKSNSARRCVPLAVLCFAFVMGSLLGCGGPSEPPRIPGSGLVTLDGAGVTDFSITFSPKQEVSGPSATTTVKDGAYAFTTITGPVAAGSYRVVVEEPPVRIPKNLRGKGGSETIPRQARHWEFEFTVPEEGPFSMDFDLK